MANSLPLPSSLIALRGVDPRLAEDLENAFLRLAMAGEALVWAQECLPDMIAADSVQDRLGFVVDRARALTEAPLVCAVRWTQSADRHAICIEAVAGDVSELPHPSAISSTVVGKVVEEQRPTWSDDAARESQYAESQSVQAYGLRSVACLPLGRRAALYLQDPDTPARFTLAHRAHLTALCTLAASVLDAPTKTPTQPAPPTIPGLVGDSPAMRTVARSIGAFAPLPWPALILGETGVGKELVARGLHALSPVAEAPFVAVNCGAIPSELAESTLFGHVRGAFTGADRKREGLVARAGGGTLFLDEVGELSPGVQVKLLRLLQEGVYEPVGGQAELTFRGRVVAATHRDLKAKGFREDLYYRLASCVLHVPPLRERASDIPQLAAVLLQRAVAELPGVPPLSLSGATLTVLRSRAWPGNVRELENSLRAAIGRGLVEGASTLEPRHFADALTSTSTDIPDELDLQTATERFQQQRVTAALTACQGNRTQAAAHLGVSRQWLHRLLHKWGPQDTWASAQPAGARP